MTRDTGRAAVYAAEDQVARLLDRAGAGASVDFFGSVLTLPVERRFADVDSVARYTAAVLALPAVRAAFPAAGPVRVRARAGATRAHYEPGPAVIAIPAARWAGRETVVLHELAHHLVSSAGGPAAPGPVHGPAFTGTLLLLVSEVIGPEAGLLLRAAFDGAGVPVGPPSPSTTGE